MTAAGDTLRILRDRIHEIDVLLDDAIAKEDRADDHRLEHEQYQTRLRGVSNQLRHLRTSLTPDDAA